MQSLQYWIMKYLNMNDLNIKIYEFTRVLGILMDNAIEAAKECDDKSNDDRIGAMNLYRMGIDYLADSQVPNTVVAE